MLDEKSAGNFQDKNLPSDPEHKKDSLQQDGPNVTRLLFKKVAHLPPPPSPGNSAVVFALHLLLSCMQYMKFASFSYGVTK
jgi:hypothetical protein